MKRALSLAVAGLIFIAGLTACGQKEVTSQESTATTSQEVKKEDTASNPVKISFATNFTNKVDNTLKDLVKEYMDQHPNVTIEIEGIADTDQVLKTRMAAGELPDVTPILANTPRSDFPLYFAPIDDLGYTKDNLYFYDNGLGEDGKLYGLNSAVVYDGIIYNKKAFNEAGITIAPKTIEEFYAVCEKLKAKGITPMGTSFKDAWPLNWYASDFVFEVGNTGDPNYKNAMKDKDALLSEDGGLLTAFKLLREMNQKGYLDKDLMSASWDSQRRDHASGKIAMIFLGSWYPPQLVDAGANKEDIGMFPFPGVKAVTQTGNWMFGISKNTKSPEAAKEFLKWLWEDARYANAVGVTTPIKGAKVDDVAISELLSYNMPMVAAAAADSKANDIFNKSEINLTQALQEYILSENPEDVVKKVNDKWQKAKKEVAGN